MDLKMICLADINAALPVQDRNKFFLKYSNTPEALFVTDAARLGLRENGLSRWVTVQKRGGVLFLHANDELWMRWVEYALAADLIRGQWADGWRERQETAALAARRIAGGMPSKTAAISHGDKRLMAACIKALAFGDSAGCDMLIRAELARAMRGNGSIAACTACAMHMARELNAHGVGIPEELIYNYTTII